MYLKFVKSIHPNLFLVESEVPLEKGEVVEVTTKYNKQVEVLIYNLYNQNDEGYYYTYTRTDGLNVQTHAKRKVEKLTGYAINAQNRAEEYNMKSKSHSDFLTMGEPIKVGHHSESRHRRLIESNWRNTTKYHAELDKAQKYMDKIDHYDKKANEINIMMPESLEHFGELYQRAVITHEKYKTCVKDENYKPYMLTYANKNRKVAADKYILAARCWGEPEDLEAVKKVIEEDKEHTKKLKRSKK